MSKNYLFVLILLGLAWLFAPVSEPPTHQEQATVAPVIRVKPVIFHMPPEEAIDRTVICGGGNDKPPGPTILADETSHRC